VFVEELSSIAELFDIENTHISAYHAENIYKSSFIADQCARGLMRTCEIERNGAMAREKLQITQRYFERHIGKAQRVNRMSARQRTKRGGKKNAASRPRVYFR